MLDNSIELSNYGNGINGIYFGFVAYPKRYIENAKDKEVQEFVTNLKVVDINYLIDYEQLMISNYEEAFTVLKATYLKALREVLPKLGVWDFDWQRFCDDLEDLFADY